MEPLPRACSPNQSLGFGAARPEVSVIGWLGVPSATSLPPTVMPPTGPALNSIAVPGATVMVRPLGTPTQTES
jgi:hypothetical protein